VTRDVRVLAQRVFGAQAMKSDEEEPMAKTRLNPEKRGLLYDLAASLVDVSEEQAEAAAVGGILQDALRSHLLERYPPGDMEVLTRYNLSCTFTSLKLGLKGAHHRDRVKVALTPALDLPRHTASLVLGPAHPLWVLAASRKSLEESVEAARVRQEAPYRTLIKTSRYYEDVVEVWEEAGSVSFKMKLQLPAAVTPAMVRQIRQDVARRAGA
jgi:hypothetical protein